MTKAEMAAQAAQYRNKMATASAAESQGLYRAAMERAMSAWDCIEGMVQFSKKYENRVQERIAAIDLVLRYAALLLDLKSVNACEGFLVRSPTLTRWTTCNLPGELAAAREALWQNYKLWTLLEQSADVRQDQLSFKLGGEAARWRAVVEDWERMGLLKRERIGRTFLLTLSTRLGAIVSARCSSCGKVAQAPKSMFLEPLACPECGAASDFVLIEDLEQSTVG